MIFFNPTDEFVDKLVEVINGRFVIEIGCGEGALLKVLLDRGVPALGVDPFVDPLSLDSSLMTKVLPLMETEFHHIFNGLKTGDYKDFVFLVARPCHSRFPQDYLSSYGDRHEMIYIGYAKNLEIDFERELSRIRFIDFPEHPDCDTVAVLKNQTIDKRNLREHDWDKVDQRAARLMGEVDPSLLAWFKDLQLDGVSRYDFKEEALMQKFGHKEASGLTGGNWTDPQWAKAIQLSSFMKKRPVLLNCSTYMVGGGHFSNHVTAIEDELVFQKPDGSLVIGRPWDRKEGRPAWASSSNPVWAGMRDSKRTSSFESALVWLKEAFEAMKKEFQEDFGIELVPFVDSGLQYELEERQILEETA